MLLSIKDSEVSTEDIERALFDHIMQNTRFNLTQGIAYKSKNVLSIAGVRLKDPKHWCGSHPNACELRPIQGREMKSSSLLEGSDWVEFNDHVNDVLDRLNVSAWVRSTRVPVEIRNGRERRINYDSYEFDGRPGLWEWDKDGSWGDWEDYCGKVAPNSTYPEGTPGKYERNVEAVDV